MRLVFHLILVDADNCLLAPFQRFLILICRILNLALRESPLNGFNHSAHRIDPVEVIKLILDAGANINAANVNQENTALHLAALKGNDKVVQYLISRGARVDIKNKLGKTAGEVGPRHTTDLIAKLTKKD